MSRRIAIIIGAGPAGLTAAFELLKRTDVKPIVLERSEYLGGISRTVCHNGNRMDIGGHRFFSKSDRVMNWWLDQLPRDEDGQVSSDEAMLVRDRKSRIYFLRRFFDYPIQLSKQTLRNLGIRRSIRIGLSYIRASLLPVRPEVSLEDFLVNRFGRELYQTFFQSYTEKVWGVPCDKISAEWGAQRIKGLSIRKVLLHVIKQSVPDKNRKQDVAQKDLETSLIEKFLYPKFGPGQMWDKIGRQIVALGGEIIKGFDVDTVEADGDRVISVSGRDACGHATKFAGDYFFSTTSVKELVAAMENGGTVVPPRANEVARNLPYRDFITVGILASRLKVREPGQQNGKLIADNWIYIQEPDVLVGRLQLFNNWSPHLLADPSRIWLGAEYFCNEGDTLWSRSDEDISRLAVEELSRIGMIDSNDVIDTVVVKMPKTYPAYFGVYDRFEEVRSYLDSFSNLFLIGRNGMHKYNNQDHSMLTAMTAVDNIRDGRTDKDNIWHVNTEQEYHESKGD